MTELVESKTSTTTVLTHIQTGEVLKALQPLCPPFSEVMAQQLFSSQPQSQPQPQLQLQPIARPSSTATPQLILMHNPSSVIESTVPDTMSVASSDPDEEMPPEDAFGDNHKLRLIHFLRLYGAPEPTFEVRPRGVAHAPMFDADCFVNGKKVASVLNKLTKKAAESSAALKAWKLLKNERARSSNAY